MGIKPLVITTMVIFLVQVAEYFFEEWFCEKLLTPALQMATVKLMWEIDQQVVGTVGTKNVSKLG